MGYAKNDWEKIKVSLVAGANANTNITMTGVATDDSIISAIGFDPDNGTPADQVKDFTSNCSITAANTIQFDVATTGYDVMVVWADKSAG